MSHELWPKSRMTGNSHLLTGYIAGMLSTRPDYHALWAESTTGELVVEACEIGNRFVIKIEQISGEE